MNAAAHLTLPLLFVHCYTSLRSRRNAATPQRRNASSMPPHWRSDGHCALL